MCPSFIMTPFSNRMSTPEKHIMERFLELHRKIRSKLCKEIFGHSMAVVVFSGLVIISIVEVLKYRDPDMKKLTAAILGICHFGLCATAILHLKYSGVLELNPVKCKIWIYLEVYNIAATTAFIVLATRHLLPPPFHQWTGTALLLIIYWLPLIMYKTSQVCRMIELVNILNYLQDSALEKHCSSSAGSPSGTMEPSRVSSTSTSAPPANTNARGNINTTTMMASSSSPSPGKNASMTCLGLGQPHQMISVPSILPISKPISVSTPHIPYEWALIDSISNALP